MLFFSFLDAPSHLYKRSCPSVRRSVRPSVRILCRVSGFVLFHSPALFEHDHAKRSRFSRGQTVPLEPVDLQHVLSSVFLSKGHFCMSRPLQLLTPESDVNSNAFFPFLSVWRDFFYVQKIRGRKWQSKTKWQGPVTFLDRVTSFHVYHMLCHMSFAHVYPSIRLCQKAINNSIQIEGIISRRE